MLNPTPVPQRTTPYSAPSPSGSLPRSLATPNTPKRARKWLRGLFLALLCGVVAVGTFAFAQYRALHDSVIVAHEGSSASILNYVAGDPGSLDQSLFTHAGDGRFNVVLVGVGGENHPGGNLTDSIQVVSVDTINKTATITSVPRDLYVNIPGYGRAKINEAYQAGEQQRKGGGPLKVREVVGSVLGIRISNFVLLDFTGAKDLVDALGGVEVTVPTAISDPTFPADNAIDFAPFSIQAGTQTLNGTTALKYMRSRHTTSDFDRSKRQQLVMEAIKKKALSAGILTNPAKVTQMISVLGRHLKSDLQTSEIRSLFSIYKDVSSSETFVLDTSAKLGLLTSSSGTAAGYVSQPVRGQDDFRDINRWFQANSRDPLISKEAPIVSVVNGGGASAKQLQEVIDALKDYGFNATLSTRSLAKKPKTTGVYEMKKGSKPFSRNYLATFFGSTVTQGSPLSSGADLEVIYVPSSSRTHW